MLPASLQKKKKSNPLETLHTVLQVEQSFDNSFVHLTMNGHL